jgi:predicted dehydrogenase
MLYIGSHLVDQVLWCMGEEPVQVSADIRYRGDTRADETTAFQLRFPRGAVAQGVVTQAAAGFFNHLDIVGRQGSINLRGNGFLHYTVEVTSTALAAYSQPTVIHVPQVDDVRIQMHLPQLAEFAEAVHARRQPSCTLAEGRRVLRVLDAFKASARLGHPVRLGSREPLAVGT